MSLFRGEYIYTPRIVGVVSGLGALASHVGEVISSAVAVGSAVALTTATPANVTSIALSPGDWDVYGHVNFTGTGTTTVAGALFTGGVNTTSATVPVDGSETPVLLPALTTTAFKAGTTDAVKVVNVTGNTTVYLVAQGAFTAGSVGAYGTLIARRRR